MSGLDVKGNEILARDGAVRRPAGTDARLIVRRAILRYAVGSLLVVGVVGAGAAVVASQIATDQAVTSAGDWTERFADQVVAPLTTSALRERDPAAIEALRRAVKLQMDENEVLRVKVWTRDGLILYSDKAQLIGRVYPLDEDDVEVLDEQTLDAHLSSSTKRENEFESGFGPTLEVYTGILSPDLGKLVVEAYLPVDRLNALRDDLIRRIGGLVVGSLLLLALLLLPLAVSLARRIAQDHEERVVLSELAADAAQAERHSVAAQLHDTVIQDLTGVGFALSTVGSAAERAGQHDLAAATRRVHQIVVEDVVSLRTMMSSLAAQDADGHTVSAVVESVAEAARQAGLQVRDEIEPGVDLPRDSRTAIGLVAREAVRNTLRHAKASSMDIRLTTVGTEVVLEIADDGQGFVPAQGPTVEDGHLGLTLYQRAAQASHGSSELTTAPGQGTRVILRLPRTAQRGLPRGLGKLRVRPRPAEPTA